MLLLQSPARMSHSLLARSFRGQRPFGSRRNFATDKSGKQSITLALYRQVLRWCESTEDNFPLSYFVPPIYLKPPQVDAESLRLLATGDEKSRIHSSMIPSKSKIEEHQATYFIQSTHDIKAYARVMFRLNSRQSNPDIQKQRVTAAFEGIKSLNELTVLLESFKENRERHMDRENVRFRVGQGKTFLEFLFIATEMPRSDIVSNISNRKVVKHKTEEWRGVIIGWAKIVEEVEIGSKKSSSLTKKTYTIDPVDNIRYSLYLDSGDAHLHSARRREYQHPSMAEVYQSDLEPVEDTRYV